MGEETFLSPMYRPWNWGCCFFFSFFLGFVALMVDWVSQPFWWLVVKTKTRKMILSKTHCVGPTISFQWSHWVLVVSLSWFAWPLFFGGLICPVSTSNSGPTSSKTGKKCQRSHHWLHYVAKIKANVSIIQEWKKRLVGCVFSYQIKTASKANADRSH